MPKSSIRARYLSCSSVELLILSVLQLIDHEPHENSYLQSWKPEGSGTIFTDYSGTELLSENIYTPKIAVICEGKRRIKSDIAGA